MKKNTYTLIGDELDWAVAAAQGWTWEPETFHHREMHSMHEEIARLNAVIKELEKLSVTNILIAVVPGDGSGQEVYAKSVDDVEQLLSRLSEKAEDYDLETVPLRCRVAQLEKANRDLLNVIEQNNQSVIAREMHHDS